MESDDQTHDTQSYMCFPLSLIDKKTHLEAGSNIIMPVSALSSSSQKLVCRMTFRVAKSNDTSTLHYHCGVAEFTADDGFVFLPTWMMKKLNIREGDLVNIKDTSLPEGNYIKVQSRTSKFFAHSDHELVLKKALRDNVACLTTGDNIVVNHNYNKYLIHIVETKPSRVVSLFENDSYEVEFAIPLDYYKQPWLDLFPSQWNGAILQGYDTIYQSRKKLMVKESTVANKQQTEFKPFTRKRGIVNMPDEIIQNILGRLPTKPLLRSRCVSAHWNRLVSDPYFMKAKLRRKILLVAPDFHAIEDNGPCGDDMVKLQYPFERRTDVGVRNIRVIGTFNGIVALVVNDDKDVGSKSESKKSENFTSHIILYNPFTGASEIIPDPYSPLYNSKCKYGFGYGATKDELKIVRFRNFKDRNDTRYTCDVFNLKERSWSTSEILMKDTRFWSDVGTFLNGSLYWLAYKKIVALDVHEMVISEIHLPCEDVRYNWLLSPVF
ncbi:ubiquitin fusion degradation protein UFD1 [Artemisia annua]|uniref:Ubiquitin fusion degradation protein UFD1 n=1 Tax=Artemisia annua TaxID=35608 RepID=A0A2U1PR05_ARTAN|nr:ubiquitin fusion degradation protein UFD1 [Artemisia annua]